MLSEKESWTISHETLELSQVQLGETLTRCRSVTLERQTPCQRDVRIRPDCQHPCGLSLAVGTVTVSRVFQHFLRGDLWPKVLITRWLKTIPSMRCHIFFLEEHSVTPPHFSHTVIGTSGRGEQRTALLFDKHGFWQPKAMLTGDNVRILVSGITLRSPLWFRVLTADVDCISTLNHIDKLPDRQRQNHVSPSQTLPPGQR